MRRQIRRRAKGEPMISLINIVFLILIFFMVAGTLAQPPRELQFLQTTSLDCCTEPDALAIAKDSRLSYRGSVVDSVSDFLALRADADGPVRLLPDRNLPATDLLKLIASLKAAGSEQIIVLTQAQPQ
ncbi:MAG: biopolymer transporter ExbD [Pseudomonadota bacterium]